MCADLTPWPGLPVTVMVKILMLIMCCHNYYLSKLNITDVFPAVDDETELNSAIFTQNEWNTVPVESPAMGSTSKWEPNVSVEGQLIWTSRGFGVRFLQWFTRAQGIDHILPRIKSLFPYSKLNQCCSPLASPTHGSVSPGFTHNY